MDNRRKHMILNSKITDLSFKYTILGKFGSFFEIIIHLLKQPKISFHSDYFIPDSKIKENNYQKQTRYEVNSEMHVGPLSILAHFAHCVQL